MRISKNNSVVFLIDGVETKEIEDISLAFTLRDANTMRYRLEDDGDSYSTVALLRENNKEPRDILVNIDHVGNEYKFTLSRSHVHSDGIITFSLGDSIF